MTSPPAEFKSCRSCGLPHKIEDFRRVKRGASRRVAVCRECRNLIDKARYSKDADQAKQSAAVEVLTHLQGRRSMARRMVFLDAAMDRFGGPEGFAQAVHRVFEATRDARIQLKCLKTVVDIARANEDRSCGDG